MMTKKERVQAVLDHKPVDRLPMGFWMHFAPEAHHGQAAVDAHLKYFQESETDICKVMNENLYPCEHNILTGSDWTKVKSYGRDSAWIQDQVEIIKRIVDKVKGEAPVIATVHGIIASASHALLGAPKYDLIGRHALVYYLRTNPQALKSAFAAISETLAIVAEESLKAGADGVYYACLGGERDVFTAEEHAEYVAPYDKVVLDAIKGRKMFNILHMCKPFVELDRFKNYECDVMNWGVIESGVSLAEGKKIFPNHVVMGGVDDRSPVLLNGTEQEIEKEIHDIIDTVGTDGFILASDCTLPSDLDCARIRAMKKACETYKAK